MAFDISTLGFVLFLVYLGNGLISILMALSGRAFRGAWLWVIGQGLMAGGALIMFLRPLAPVWVAVILGNGAYVASCFLFAHSIWVLRFRASFPRWIYALIPVVLISFWLVFDESFAVRAQVSSFWVALGSLSIATLLVWKVERQYLLANSMTALPFLGAGWRR